MASNNQRSPSGQLPPRRPNGNKKNSKEHQQMILNQVKEMFDSILDPDVILSVVQNCKWKLQPSIDALIMLSETAETPANQNNQNLSNQNTASFNCMKKQNKDSQTKSQNIDRAHHKSNVDQDAGFLNLNDKELQRQQEEFRKFERLKKDLTQKGFGSTHENMSKFNHPVENKISSSKLQQFSQNWFNPQGTFGKDDTTKGFNPQIKTDCFPRGYVASNSPLEQPHSHREGSKQQNEDLGQPEFNQFSQDLPNKLYSKGTIPKNSQGFPKSPANMQSQQNFSQPQKNFESKTKNFNPKGPNTQNIQNALQGRTQKVSIPQNFHFNQCNTSSYNSMDFNFSGTSQELSHSPKPDWNQQEVEQFNVSHDNHNDRKSSKSNPHKSETESLCGLKVQYRLPGLENSSDDDADVVIEEEITDYFVQIPSLMSVNVCQFLSSPTQSPPKNTYPEICMINTPSPPMSPQHSAYEKTFSRIISTILEGSRILILLRGIPGSGKSYLARSIIHCSIGCDPTPFIFSTDDYFVMVGGGVYQFDSLKLQEAHSFNQKKVWNAFKEGRSPIIVDNTNTQSWEMQPYASMAVKQGYIIEVLEPNTPWVHNVNELVKKNAHGVSKDKIKHMIERYDKNITGPKLLQQFSLKYDPKNMPPQPRIIPPLESSNENSETISDSEKAKGTRKPRVNRSGAYRRRTKKTGTNRDADNDTQSSDPSNGSQNNTDENMQQAKNPTEASSSEDTIENDGSNTLTSESDVLSKSLVDYSIETDSADDIDVNKLDSPDEESLKEIQIFRMSPQNVSNETVISLTEPSPLLVDPAILKAIPITKEDLSSFENELSTSLKSDMTQNSEDLVNTLHQHLGAIGSERKGSLTIMECEDAITEKVDAQNDKSENVLSQCWDFTLLLNGAQIHSVGPIDFSKLSRRNSLVDPECHNKETNAGIDNFEKEFVSDDEDDSGTQFRVANFCESETTIEPSDVSCKADQGKTENGSKGNVSTDCKSLSGSSRITTENLNRKIAFDYNSVNFNEYDQEHSIFDDSTMSKYHDFSNEENSIDMATDEKFQSTIDDSELEDADSVMARIINKMDDLEIERNVLTDAFMSTTNRKDELDKDLEEESTDVKSVDDASCEEAILMEEDEILSPDLEADRKSVQERSTIGSIFSMIKKSFLGGHNDQKPVEGIENAQSLNENNTKSDSSSRDNVSSTSKVNNTDDSPGVDEDSALESPRKPSVTTVSDTLTKKLSNTTYDDDNSDIANATNDITREISNPIVCDTLDINMSDLFINDTLSKKLSDNTVHRYISSTDFSNTNKAFLEQKSKAENDFEHKIQNVAENDNCINPKTDSKIESTDNDGGLNDSYCKSRNLTNPHNNFDGSNSKSSSERTDVSTSSTHAISESSVDSQSDVNSQENLSAKSSSSDLNTLGKMNLSDISDVGLSDIAEEVLNESWITISGINDNLEGMENASFPSVSEIEAENATIQSVDLEKPLENKSSEESGEFSKQPDDQSQSRTNTIVRNIDNKEHNDIRIVNASVVESDNGKLKSHCEVEKIMMSDSFGNIKNIEDIVALISYIQNPTSDKTVAADQNITDEIVESNLPISTRSTANDPSTSGVSPSEAPEQSLEEVDSEHQDKGTMEKELPEDNSTTQIEELDPNLQKSVNAQIEESDCKVDSAVVYPTRSTNGDRTDSPSSKLDPDFTNSFKLIEIGEYVETLGQTDFVITCNSAEECAIAAEAGREIRNFSGNLEKTVAPFDYEKNNSIVENILSYENESSSHANCSIQKELILEKNHENPLPAPNSREIYNKSLENDSCDQDYGSGDAQNVNAENVERSIKDFVTECEEVLAAVKDLSNAESDKLNEDNTVCTVKKQSPVHSDASTASAVSSEHSKPDFIDNINEITWKESPFPTEQVLIPIVDEKSVVTTLDSSTNTSYYDFNVSYIGGTSEPEYRILEAFNRSINDRSAIVQAQKTPLKLRLDKGCMTNDIDVLSSEASPDIQTVNDNQKNIKELMEMFPNVPKDDLTEIYEQLCNFDFNWAVDVLLDGVPENGTRYSRIEPPRIVLEKCATPSTSSESNDSESKCSCPNTSQKKKGEKLKQQSSSSESNDCESTGQSQNSTPRKKKDKNKVSESTLELKRQIEEKMKINEASYNPHILRVKRWKNGEPDITTDSIAETQNQNKEAIEFHLPGDALLDYSAQMAQTSELQDTGSSKTSESADEFTEDDIEPEEMMELNLGQNFIKVLENEFGNSEFQIPDGLFPVIQIKKSMAQQLHALWIESMQQQLDAQQEQLDKMLEKDAEYARSLEEEEARALTEPEVPNLHEIMDMELALAIYNNDMKEQLKRETPTDMASRLTRQMLHEMFPQFDPETLNEILNAHKGNFVETVEILEASTGHTVSKNDTLKKQKSLLERVKKETIQPNEREQSPSHVSPLVVVNPELSHSSNSNSERLTHDAAIEEAETARKEAQRHLTLRNENFTKAQEAYRKGNSEVAVYYSNMAKLHSKKIELANATAASAFLAAQAYVADDNNTLDLHYLYVPEALQALDVFLEFHIARLNEGTKKSMVLYIITGRGARSNKGLSRIKPAVSKRLAAKNIRFMDENPGCLKIVLHRGYNAMG